MTLSFAISIHALREEGDHITIAVRVRDALFLSTPSARRATSLPHSTGCGYTISIHALREEGDAFGPHCSQAALDISIHALREEGDWAST